MTIGIANGWLTVVAGETHWRLCWVNFSRICFVSWPVKHKVRENHTMRTPNLDPNSPGQITVDEAMPLVKRYYWLFTDPLAWVKISETERRIDVPRR
jgi:hypothetical protein